MNKFYNLYVYKQLTNIIFYVQQTLKSKIKSLTCAIAKCLKAISFICHHLYNRITVLTNIYISVYT